VSVSFTVFGVAQPAGSKKAFVVKGRAVITDDAKRSRPWKTQVAQEAGLAMADRPLLDGPLLLELTFWVPRPKGHFGAKGVRPSAPRHPTVRPDVLKLARAVEDALTGVVYRDDAQICCETLQKAYTLGRARCEVRLIPIEEATAAA
jgi:Holliday junction resolvase RusA-like endonuclease